LHPYTRGLMAAIPRLGSSLEEKKTRLAEIPGIVPSLRNMPQGCSFAPRCPFASDQCRKEYPPLEDAHGGHLVACWNWRNVIESEGAPV
jgi:oligopeptide/dipeptide ABC transporter ATP-binding protein